MSEDEKALALALDSAFLRDCDSTEGVRAASTPRLRLEAAQLLADKVGHDSHSPPSEANLMDEIFKGGSSSFVSAAFSSACCRPWRAHPSSS